ncbi:hypothetical protein GWO43_28250 [candidate division KSB1 bacterium]|nr:hypothetical protein [candidate division KSB1 bacterium]NIR70785.1 hypothetical protein [candidate division KSB1 bacterium]NIS27800.1 hypothetical protein [candidate division KSB1 bacterium]NIT74682.1 hypothetical protein [candidate division KSB1 bacterium]NIU28467.1 hypothetical protein [candidate division KSB1 bacterium]
MHSNILTRIFIIILLATLSTRCGDTGPTLPKPGTDTFTFLTYNVAGLPQGISPSNPEKNTPLISPLLNKYDIALVQEDFFYHEELKAQARHPFQSESNNGPGQFDFGDGLNRFSMFPFEALRREQWSVCSGTDGNDCLARKGFSVSETTLAPGVIVDIYNLHLDAGGGPEDFSARNMQVEQLLRTLNSRSSGKAIIVAGDTNFDTDNRQQDAELLQRLFTGASLTDACRFLSCGQEMVDRVLFRGNGVIDLTPISWQIDPDFVDEEGNKLSDHFAIGVTFKWTVE